MEKISVAIATYNGSKYILEQLESISNQELLPNEVIISDDSSHDNTIEILKRFKEKAPFEVRIIENKKNKGYTKNFEIALSACTGDYIFLADQDDVWFKNKIKSLIAIAEKNTQYSLFMHDAIIVDQLLSDSGTTKLKQLESLKLKSDNFVTGACTLIRKDFLNKALPIPDGFEGHDNWIVSLADITNKKKIIYTPFMYYRRHNLNTSNEISSSLNKINNIQRIQNLLFKYILIKGFHRKNLLVTLSRNNALITKLKNNPDLLSSCEPSSMIKLTAKNDSLKIRIMILNTPCFFRIFTSHNLLIKGYYKHFRGYRSCLLDIISR